METGVEPAISNALSEPSTTLTTSPNIKNLPKDYNSVNKNNSLEQQSLNKASDNVIYTQFPKNHHGLQVQVFLLSS